MYKSARNKTNLLSYDVARLLAMAAVVYQHVLPVYGFRLHVSQFPNIGQLGVTVFCGLSGFFSFRNLAIKPLDWSRARLARVLPPYWIALTGVLALNALAHYKPVSIRTDVMEYLGLAALIDDEHRIGQPFWFITLILLCYALAACLRGRPRLLLLAMVCAALMLRPGEWFAPHILSFLLGGLMCGRRGLPFSCGLVLFATAMAWVHNPAWLYPLSSVLCLTACSLTSRTSPFWLSEVSDKTYEFYLVHGTAYLALATYGHLSLQANIILGTVVAGAAAYLLAWIALSIQRVTQKLILRPVLQSHS